MTLNTTLREGPSPMAGQRMPIGDLMKYEILINEKARLWVFHDQPLPGRLAWIEFDPQNGELNFIPHDMSRGMVYAESPPSLRSRIPSVDLAFLYLTDGEKVHGFQKVPVRIKRV